MQNAASKLVRIKLELEEYDFDILYIKGKDNIQADALSRIPFSEIKNMATESKKILAITRSKTRAEKINERKDGHEPQKEIENNSKTVIYKRLTGFNKKVPRMKTYMNNDKNITISAHLKRKKLFTIEAKANDKLSVILSTLEMASQQAQINEIQLATNDSIFEIFTADEFINECAKHLKWLKIAIIEPVIHVKNVDEQQKILHEYHYDRIRGGHCGRNRLYASLRAKYYWRNMRQDVAKLVRSCKQCTINKPRPGTREPMAITPTPQKAFDCVIMDTIGPMQKTVYGNSYAITLICDLTKYLITVPIPNKEAKTIAKAVFENFILIYGTPKTIRTDLGTEYKNEIMKELCKMLNMEHNFSTAYHHESLGTIERNHRIFNEYLRAYADNDSWDVQLRYFTYCFNISFNGSLNNEFTPFELVFGRRANDIASLNEPIQRIYNHENYISILKYTLQLAHQKAREFIIRNKMKNKKYYDEKINTLNIQVNDKILIKNEPYNKFNPLYSGPYKVIQIENQNLIIEKDNKPYKIHKNRTIKE